MLLPDLTSLADLDVAINALFKLAEDRDIPLDHLEEQCHRALMAVGRAVMKKRLEQVPQPARFDDGDRTWRVAVQSRLDIVTWFGHVLVDRPLYRCERNGPTRDLLAEEVGLVAGLWTPRAAKLAALAIAEMPMSQADAFFREADLIGASRSSMLRLAASLSTVWEEDRAEHEQTLRESTPIPPEASTVAVSLDGVMLLMANSTRQAKKAAAREQGQPDKGPAGYQEASVGVVSFYSAEGVRLATRRYGRMPESDKATTKTWLAAELRHIREVRPDLTTMAIADGAANNWTFLEQLEPDVQLVDFFHTAEHLHRHVSKANGASSLDTQAKLKDMRHRLLRVPGGAAAVFADMQAMREEAGTEPVSTRKTAGKRQPTYFERHHGRMDYPEALARNLPIGSGVTESTCKLAICDRMRRTGMRWGAPGGQAVLTLRALRISGQFDSAWNCLMAANRGRMAA